MQSARIHYFGETVKIGILDSSWGDSSSRANWIRTLESLLLWFDEDVEVQRRRSLELEAQQAEFHGFVREHVICLLVFMTLYILSHWLISRFRARPDHDALYSGDEDFFVYRISMWMCSWSLATSLGAITLLPASMVGYELLERHIESPLLTWLSPSLIRTLWNYVFAFSNLSLFLLLPFSYFFIESQGFDRRKHSRIYETAAVCVLFFVVMLCLADVVYTLVFSSSSMSFSILSLRSPNLALVYSCLSLLGVVLLLVSTPIGFLKMFSVPPKATKTSENGFLEKPLSPPKPVGSLFLRHVARLDKNGNANSVFPRMLYEEQGSGDSSRVNSQTDETRRTMRPPLRQRSLRWYQHVLHTIKYPLVMLLLLAVTVSLCGLDEGLQSLSLLLVLVNAARLWLGLRALPVYAQYVEVHSRHAFGLVGVVVESLVTLYTMAASLVGVYSMPGLRSLIPRRKSTSMTAVIINCATVLVLSSALPVLARTLGLTTFDLLGFYGRLNWLSNLSLVLTYNVVFVAVTVLCLFNSLTSPVRKEITRKLRELRFTREESLKSE